MHASVFAIVAPLKAARNGTKLPNGERAVSDLGKRTNYCLNPHHEDAGARRLRHEISRELFELHAADPLDGRIAWSDLCKLN
jgi:hypothetical protein